MQYLRDASPSEDQVHVVNHANDHETTKAKHNVDNIVVPMDHFATLRGRDLGAFRMVLGLT
jgi:hypothetical protein